MNKKTYINPEFEFVSFDFEAVATATAGGVTPTPLINPQDAAGIVTLSGNFLAATPTMMPDKYDGVKYYGLEFSADKFE